VVSCSLLCQSLLAEPVCEPVCKEKHQPQEELDQEALLGHRRKATHQVGAPERSDSWEDGAQGHLKRPGEVRLEVSQHHDPGAYNEAGEEGPNGAQLSHDAHREQGGSEPMIPMRMSLWGFWASAAVDTASNPPQATQTMASVAITPPNPKGIKGVQLPGCTYGQATLHTLDQQTQEPLECDTHRMIHTA